MEPAYPEGSRVQAERLVFAAPARMDVVVVASPKEPGQMELKRVIGLPGERVTWSRGRFAIDGAPLEEPYARIPESPPGDDARDMWQLGPDEYFVAGDNRLYSRDSRVYGPIRRSAIRAKVLARDHQEEISGPWSSAMSRRAACGSG